MYYTTAKSAHACAVQVFCTTYAAWQLQSAIHYIQGQFLELPNQINVKVRYNVRLGALFVNLHISRIFEYLLSVTNVRFHKFYYL